MKGVLGKLVLLFFLLLLPCIVASAIATAISIAVDIAVITYTYKLVGYITRQGIIPCLEQSHGGSLCAMVVPQHFQTDFLPCKSGYIAKLGVAGRYYLHGLTLLST